MCLLKKHDAKYGLQENPKHAYASEKRLTQPYSSLYSPKVLFLLFNNNLL